MLERAWSGSMIRARSMCAPEKSMSPISRPVRFAPRKLQPASDSPGRIILRAWAVRMRGAATAGNT